MVERREEVEKIHSPNDILKMVGFSDVVVQSYFSLFRFSTHQHNQRCELFFVVWVRDCEFSTFPLENFFWLALTLLFFCVICNYFNSNKSPSFFMIESQNTSIWSMICVSYMSLHNTRALLWAFVSNFIAHSRYFFFAQRKSAWPSNTFSILLNFLWWVWTHNSRVRCRVVAAERKLFG